MRMSVLSLSSLLRPLKSSLDTLSAFMATPMARRLVLGFFVFQAIVLVFTVKIGVPPDETNHTQFVQYYANHSLSPVFTDQQPTYNLGDKTREVDYLYHYVMSLIVRVLPLSLHTEYTIIRLVSVAAGLLSFLVLARVLRRLGVSPAVITTSFLVLTNLPMVLMMSSAINNDAFVWLGLGVGLLLLLRLWDRPSALDFLWLVALVLAGGLVKRTLLPLGMVFGILGLMLCIRRYRSVLSGFKKFDWRMVLAIGVVVISLGLFMERVGGNLVRYGDITVSCEQVHGEVACYDFWANVRARALARQTPEAPIAPANFVVRWMGESFSNIVDIQTQGWRHEVKPARWLAPFLATILLSGVVLGAAYEWRRFRNDRQSRQRVMVIGVALFFMLVHLLVNYGEYKRTKFFGIALNGRYIIPSVLPLAVLAAFYWNAWLKRYPRLVTLLVLGIVLATILASGLIMMFRNPQLVTG